MKGRLSFASLLPLRDSSFTHPSLLSIHPSIHSPHLPPFHLSHLLIHPSIYSLTAHPCFCPSNSQPIHPSTYHHSIYLSIYLSILYILYIYLLVHLSTCPSIHPSIQPPRIHLERFTDHFCLGSEGAENIETWFLHLRSS